MKQPLTRLTKTESDRFIHLEKIIKKGEETFIEVGLALAEIQQKKLYREDFQTFEEYCRECWKFSRQHAYRLIEAAPVAKCNPGVTNLKQAHALAKVPPPRRQSVVQKIVDAGKKVTAAAINHAMPPKRPVERILDGTGLEVPKECKDLWNRMSDAQTLLTEISRVRGELKRAQEEKDLLFVEVDFADSLAKLNQVYLDLQRAKPYAVCPTCSGVDFKGCATCKGRGFVSKFYWDHNVDSDTKKISGRK